MGFSYFRKVLHKIPRPLFPPPPRGSRHSFPQLTGQCREVCERGEGMCAYQPYTLRERHPLFFRYPPLTLCSPVSTSGPLTPSR